MSKHTPGPWDVSECGSIGFEDGYLGEAYDFNATTETDLPMMANARLMAAAPEMFDALQDLYKAFVLQSIPSDTALQKAITLYEELNAKIEGDEEETLP